MGQHPFGFTATPAKIVLPAPDVRPCAWNGSRAVCGPHPHLSPGIKNDFGVKTANRKARAGGQKVSAPLYCRQENKLALFFSIRIGEIASGNTSILTTCCNFPNFFAMKLKFYLNPRLFTTTGFL
jgi:hypothetical protein